MNILGIDTNTIYSSLISGLGIFMMVFGIVAVLGGLTIWFVMSHQKKKIFTFPIILLRTDLHGKILKEIRGLKGGRAKDRGIATFKIIIPKQWKKHDLGYMPDFSLAESDNTLIFTSSGDNTLWQQCTRIMQTEIIESYPTQDQIVQFSKDLEQVINNKYPSSSNEEKQKIYDKIFSDWYKENSRKEIKKLLIVPVRTEIKTKTLNDLFKVRNLFEKDKLKAGGIVIGGLIILVIAHLISLYIQTKIRCPT